MSHAKSTVSAALVVAAIIAGLAAGCETTDPYTGEKKTSSATFGALIGAGTGAAIGTISGHDPKQRKQRAPAANTRAEVSRAPLTQGWAAGTSSYIPARALPRNTRTAKAG